MTNKYVGLEQYKRGIDSIKEYVDKSIPHFEEPEVIFTLPSDKVLEIYNSNDKAMEFDKPSNINLDYEFIVNYNNEDITDISVMDNGDFKIISFINNNIVIALVPGVDINQNINENKMVVGISKLNTDITPTDVVLKQIKTKYLNNKYLKNDVAIRNSITIGSRKEGYSIGQYSFSNGRLNTVSGPNSHAEGLRCTASGPNSHAEGLRCTASGPNSHAEGNNTTASGYDSHAEGSETTAEADYSHAEGNNTTASGSSSHAEGYNTIASSENQHVQGKYNIEDTANKYAHIVGNGSSTSERSNAHTLDWSGNGWYAGSVYTGGTGQDDSNAKKLATEEYVNRNKVSKTSDLTNDSGFITSIPSEYITEEELTAKNYIDNTTLESKGYLTEHQDLSDYALRSDLHTHSNKAILDAITSAKITEWNSKSTFSGSYDDLTDKPTIPTITNDLTNALKANYDAAYTHSQSAHAPANAQKNSDITKAEIEAKLTGNITTHTHSQYLTEHQDLSGYARVSDLHTHTNKAILDAITSDKINSWDSKSTFSGSYNDLADKPTIPTKTSQLTNDSGYLTEHQSLVGLATETYVNGKVSDLVNSSPATLDTLKELADALGNDPNFATTVSNQIGNKVDKVSGKGLSTNDLTNALKANYDTAYNHSKSAHAPSNAQKNSDITKAEIEAKLTGNITTHTHSQYLTSIPSEYITEQELTSKGYITEAVLTSKGYATESQINSAVEAAATTDEEVKTTVNQILGGVYIE